VRRVHDWTIQVLTARLTLTWRSHPIVCRHRCVPVPAAMASKTELTELNQRATAGGAAARYALAELLEAGDGVVQDYAAALHLLRLAAVQGFAPAQWRLGSILSQTALANQFGVKVDRVAALRWLEAAAWQGHEEAMTAMACAYEYGFGTTADLATAA